jgi:RNA polymerase sigma-70 factor (ECF subfamily)
MAIDIKHLTEQAMAGDVEAFGRLYETHARDMYRYALYALGSESLAQDAVQQAALAAWRGVRALRDPERFRPWLLRILCNACKRQLRGKYADAQCESLEERFGDLPGKDADLCRALELRQALAALPGGEREIVLLSVLGGYESAEIGQALGLPPGTVRSKLSRALAKLRKEIAA